MTDNGTPLEDIRPTVYEAWADVMAAVQAVRKDSRNTQQNFNFRGIDAVINAVGPALREHHVIVVPERIVELSYRDVVVGQKQTPMRECTIRTQWRAIGPQGDSFTFETAGEALDSGDKGTAKAQSVAMRVSLLQALCIPTDDPDPDSESHERAYDTNGSQTRRSAEDLRGQPDPWATEPERTTDFLWLEDIRARLVACTTVAEVRGLWSEAVQVYAEHRLSTDDSAVLKAEMDARAKELKGEPAAVAG